MICFPLDNTEYDAAAVGVYMATRTRGVLCAEGNLSVSAGGAMNVVVSPGIAWLKRAEYWGVGARLENSTTLPIEAADGVLSRLDVVVFRLDKVANKAEIAIKKGAFAETPVFVDPVRDDNADELYLASVLVGPGAVTITAADVSDLRLDERCCGLMRDGVTGIPTAQLQEQAEALIAGLQSSATTLITDLETEIANVKDGSAYMLKTAYEGSAAGVVKDSDKLGGQPPSSFATAAQGLRADAAMPLAGGTFAGNAVACSVNRTGASLRNVEVRVTSTSGALQSTDKIVFVRK